MDKNRIMKKSESIQLIQELDEMDEKNAAIIKDQVKQIEMLRTKLQVLEKRSVSHTKLEEEFESNQKQLAEASKKGLTLVILKNSKKYNIKNKIFSSKK
jgi:hypothetical protein